MCAEMLSLSCSDQQGSKLETTAVLEDLSPGGSCPSSNVPLTVGRKVDLSAEVCRAEGEVRYCELGEYGYLVGVQFADGQEWSREDWRPQHLLSFG